MDDQKIFAQVTRVNCQFVFRVKHADRLVEVYNERLQCWEGPEHLSELAASVPWSLNIKVAFHHAHKTRHTTVSLGWLVLRLPTTQLRLWALVAYDTDLDRQIILLTNIPIRTAEDAEQIYTRWRCRPRIEHTYRFDQEQGLDIEDVRVQTIEYDFCSAKIGDAPPVCPCVTGYALCLLRRPHLVTPRRPLVAPPGR